MSTCVYFYAQGHACVLYHVYARTHDIIHIDRHTYIHLNVPYIFACEYINLHIHKHTQIYGYTKTNAHTHTSYAGYLK